MVLQHRHRLLRQVGDQPGLLRLGLILADVRLVRMHAARGTRLVRAADGRLLLSERYVGLSDAARSAARNIMNIPALRRIGFSLCLGGQHRNAILAPVSYGG